MEFNDGFVSAEHQELLRSATESADPTSVSPLEVTSPKSPRTPRGKQSPNRGSPVKHYKHSPSGRDGGPKKGTFHLFSFYFIFMFLICYVIQSLVYNNCFGIIVGYYIYITEESFVYIRIPVKSEF